MTLCFQNCTVSNSTHPLFEPLNFSLSKGVVALSGPSGAGKSTFLLGVVGLLEPHLGLKFQGECFLNNTPISCISAPFLRRQVCLLPQQPVAFVGSIFDNVLVGARCHTLVNKKQEMALAEKVLRQVGLWKEVNSRLSSSALALSVGQKQRLALARALAIEPCYLMLDEPTSALDSKNAGLFEDLIQDLKTQKGCVLVSHSSEQIKKLANSVVDLKPFSNEEIVSPDFSNVAFNT
jgi:phosphate transport system ATP-binding protein